MRFYCDNYSLHPLYLLSIIFAMKTKLLKNYQKCFLFYQKYPFALEIIKFLYFTVSLFFLFLAIAAFIEEAD